MPRGCFAGGACPSCSRGAEAALPLHLTALFPRPGSASQGCLPLLFVQYIEHFAEPGDPEYEPPAPETRPPEPRVFANPELPTQARVDLETKLEK